MYKHVKKAILKYLSKLWHNKSGRVIPGQFENWDSVVKSSDDKVNHLGIIKQKTGKRVRLRFKVMAIPTKC
jgi:hypothetical protein